MKLRSYQRDCIEAIQEHWRSGAESVLVELATGLGKTVIFSEVAKEWKDGRVLVVAPMLTLISQAAEKLRRMTGTMPDIEQANLAANENQWFRNQFVVASKDTLCSTSKRYGGYRFERFTDIGLVVVDEAHLSITESWRRMLGYYRERGAKILGVTATAKRADGIGMHNVFDCCAYQYGIADAVQDGWLVPSITRCVQVQSLDLSLVGTATSGLNKGDFVQKDLNAALENEKTVCEIADIAAKESFDGGNPLKTVVYCASVSEAERVAIRLSENYKLKADWICADEQRCPKHKRNSVLKSFSGDPDGIQIVANVGILTLGWDFPGLQHIVMARPTKSLVLYTQIYGRGTRPLDGIVDFEDSTPELRRERIASSGKPYFKVTDLVDNSLAHKIITAVDVLGGKELDPVKELARDLISSATGDIRTDEAILEAKRQIAEREEQERQRKMREYAERMERKRQREIAAAAEYYTFDVNPHDLAGSNGAVARRRTSGPRMQFGKYVGKLISDVPTGYLRWFSEQKFWRNQPGWIKKAISDELGERQSEPITERQAYFLSHHGVDPKGLTKLEASRKIDEIKRLEIQGAST